MGTFRTRRAPMAALVSLISFALAAGCSDPDLASDLIPEGPPEVPEVNVLSESSMFAGDLRLGEAATFCRGGDQYKVNSVYCPLARDGSNTPIPGEREIDPALDALPYAASQGFNDTYWHVRLVFDELLDPAIERLDDEGDGFTSGHIADTMPVTLRCGDTAVAYDGFYDPSGNHLSYPPGPALVVSALDFVSTGTMCEISINDNVTDTDGEAVPGEQRGPYSFGVAPLAVYETDPADMSEGVDPAATVSVVFNAPIDLATAAGKITLSDGAADVPVTLAYFVDDTGTTYDWIVEATPDAALDAGAAYTVTIDGGIADVAGGPLTLDAPITFGFTTAP